jgi:Kef-type K+ transport system membrane component KefB
LWNQGGPAADTLPGIHPIFGGFLAGLIVPHDGGFAIALVEKLEDLVTIVFLPIVGRVCLI